ncbi:MAG: hypothetical protein Q9224_003345 [Gallowayella concinna]
MPDVGNQSLNRLGSQRVSSDIPGRPPVTNIPPLLGQPTRKHPGPSGVEMLNSQWPPKDFRSSASRGSMSFPNPTGSPMRYPTLMPTPDPELRWAQASLASHVETRGVAKTKGGKSEDLPAAYVKKHPPRGSSHDEFDGPHQFLDRPPTETTNTIEHDLPRVETHLLVHEQDIVLGKVNDRLSQCAFDFVAKYQFPIPLEQDKRPVQYPSDREWNEWVFLLKRLATKRRIPARVIYNGQIKQLVTILENSLEMRHAAKHQSRPLKDDRNVLQLISAGLQVAKILKDAACMEYMDSLYLDTEKLIRNRKANFGSIV